MSYEDDREVHELCRHVDDRWLFPMDFVRHYDRNQVHERCRSVHEATVEQYQRNHGDMHLSMAMDVEQE
jgi:hypothetical protein